MFPICIQNAHTFPFPFTPTPHSPDHPETILARVCCWLECLVNNKERVGLVKCEGVEIQFLLENTSRPALCHSVRFLDSVARVRFSCVRFMQRRAPMVLRCSVRITAQTVPTQTPKPRRRPHPVPRNKQHSSPLTCWNQLQKGAKLLQHPQVETGPTTRSPRSTSAACACSFCALLFS